MVSNVWSAINILFSDCKLIVMHLKIIKKFKKIKASLYKKLVLNLINLKVKPLDNNINKANVFFYIDSSISQYLSK